MILRDSLRMLFFSFFMGLFSVAEGQFVVEATNDVTVLRQGGSTFFNPWTGGVNAVQVSKLDADLDGAEDDIFIFDRAGNRTMVLIGENINGEMTYRLEQNFRLSFPQMRNFALLRDYDCDGKKDIFTYSLLGGAMAIYKNTSEFQNLTWELTSEAVLSFYDFGSTSYTTNIYTSSQDIPAIFDYEGDGDLDVMSFNVGGSFIELHLNSSIDDSGLCGLNYFLANRCYGGFIEGDDSNDIIIDPDLVEAECTFNVVDPRMNGGLRHIGSTILTLDGNDDGLHDIVLGDVGFENLVYLENSSQSEDPDQITSFDPNFPFSLGGDIALINNFPSSFYEDVDGDGVCDLLVSVNATAGAATNETIQLYLNSGTESAPEFSFTTSSFLQNEMLDWGSYSSPSAVDYNGDGLMDLIIGCRSDLPNETLNESRLILLENIGSAEEPSFRIMDTDWLDLPSLVSAGDPSPAFGDFDGDGDQDLVVGFLDGTLHYFDNDNGWTYEGPIPTSDTNFDVGISASPAAYDVDDDGKLDLVVGESEGNLNFFKNSGDSNNPMFTLTDEALGGVNTTTTPPFFEGKSAPFFFEFEGEDYLAIGSKSGKIFQHEVGGALEAWPEIAEGFSLYDNFDSAPLGLHTKPIVLDFNGDGIPEVISGMITGGLEYFAGSGYLSSERNNGTNTANFNMYPNPSKGELNIDLGEKSADFKKLTIVALDGRIVYSSNRVRTSYDISHIAKGAYVVRIESESNSASEMLIKQ